MASRICPACSSLNAQGDARCYRCGAPLDGPRAALLRLSRVEFIGTKVLIGLCALNFVVMMFANGSIPFELFGSGVRPSAVLFVGAMRGMLGSEIEQFRMLSAVFVHLGLLHIGLNMMALQSLGSAIEYSQGTGRMVVLFVVSGVLGFLASRIYYGPIGPTTAGASGAIFGLLGVRIAELRRARDPRAKAMLLQNLAYAVAFALLFPVNNAAHFGGFAAGYLLTELIMKFGRRLRPSIWYWIAVFAVLLSIGAQVASALSPWSREARRLEEMPRGF